MNIQPQFNLMLCTPCLIGTRTAFGCLAPLQYIKNEERDLIAVVVVEQPVYNAHIR